VAFDEALAMVERGEITDSMSVIGILKEALDRSRHVNMSSHRHTIRLFDLSLGIVRLPAGTPLPDWATRGFFSVTRTPDELSVVAEARFIPENLPAERGWRVLRVEGALPLSQIGILAGLATTLAAAGVPIFSISTFDTDYLLVRDADVAAALTALRSAGHHVLG
jgi:hypothetical protein